MRKVFIVLTFIASTLLLTSSKGLREEFTWTRISYEHLQRPTRQARYKSQHSHTGDDSDGIIFPGATNADSGNNRPTRPPRPDTSRPSDSYIYENNVPMGANVWKDKLFITVPRRRLGVPSTLNYVWLNSTNRHNEPLIPYPNLETNSLSNPDGLASTYRVAVDSCNLLWAVDTGVIEIPGNATRIRPTQLVIINLLTNQIERRHVIDESFLRPATTLASVTLDHVADSCDNTYAYMPDLGGYGLIVYSYRDDRSWRVAHNYFFLEPLAGEFNIGGHQFQWNDGIFSVALSESKSNGFRDAYFHSMAGTHLYKVSTRILQNETLATRSFHGNDFQVVGDRGSLSQTSSSDIYQPGGILFLGLVNQNALGCWKINSPIRDIGIIQKDDETMIYPCDVKVQGNKVILLTNTMPRFLYGRLNYDEINFRVWIENVAEAIKDSKCASGGRPNY